MTLLPNLQLELLTSLIGSHLNKDNLTNVAYHFLGRDDNHNNNKK